MVYSLPGSSIHGILQARILECCHFLLQGIFPTQGLNLCLLHWQADSLPLSHLGSSCVSYCSCRCQVASAMSDSEGPHRWQPIRLCRPWNSPGKNTGVGCHFLLQCTKVKRESEVAHSCLTCSDPMDYSLPGSSIHGILQARVLEWVAIAFSKGSSRPRDRTCVSCIGRQILYH